MKKYLLFMLLSCITGISAMAQCVNNINFNNWIKTGLPANGNWVVQGGGTSVQQTINGENTYFISPTDFMNVRLSGTFRSTDDDDDWMGFVFSFLNPMGAIDTFDCWLFDWKQENQGGSPRGMSINRIDGVIVPAQFGTHFNNHQNGPAFTVVDNDFQGPGWIRNFNHEFILELTFTRARIFVDGNLVFDVVDCFKPGRFGFYNKSQKDCFYANFEFEPFADFTVNKSKACLNDVVSFNFVNPCTTVPTLNLQSMTWDFGDGTPPIVINNPTPSNANVTHAFSTAGNFQVVLTIVDNLGCTTASANLVEVRNPIVVTGTLVPPLCNGALNGSLTANATGGFGNYLYSWNGGVNTQQTWNGQPAGTYTVQVSDVACNTTATFTLNQPTPLNATTTHTDASCGLNNGSVSITISGGTPPYQNVNWAGIPGATRTGLGPNTYIADFRDANGCSSLLQFTETVNQLPCGITSNITKTDVKCFGANDGSITLAITGTTGTANIVWRLNGTVVGNGPTITGLGPGIYTFNYTDGDPLHAFNGSVTIVQPGAAMVAALTTTPISCSGANDGTAIASVTSGGNAPFNYSWSGGQPNNPLASNLGPGNISVVITDAIGCTATASGNIAPTPSLAINFISNIDSCFNSGKGNATAVVSGGSRPYSYAWSNFIIDSANLNIRAGKYVLTVTDFKNCTVVDSITITGPAAPLSSSFNLQDILCKGDDNGSIAVTITGGTPNYNIVWDVVGVSGTNLTNLTVGPYNTTITDALGCMIINGDTIFEPDSVLTVTAIKTNVTCNGANNGSVELTVLGGTPPYTFQGNPINIGLNTFSNLAPGAFTGDVLDANNCAFTVNEVITEPGLQSLTLTGTNNPCFGATQGVASANFVNATGTVNYVWTGGLTGATVSNLSSGIFTVTATDQNNCVLIDSIEIFQPSTVLSATTVAQNVTCNGNSDGSIAVTITGGTPNYNIVWANPSVSGVNPTGLNAGTYNYNITDANGCVFSGVDSITQPAALQVAVLKTDAACNGANNGSVELTVLGGTPPYTFQGNPINIGLNTFSNLAPGAFTGDVLDANNCTFTVNEIITEPGLQSLTLTGTNNPCFGATQGTASANFVNATGTVNYVWTGALTGATISNLAAGFYTVTATDANSCVLVDSIEITQPASPIMTVNVTDASCFGANGTAIANPSGGTAPFVFQWSGSTVNTPTANLPAGNYTVTAIDAVACQQLATFTVNEPTEITTQSSITQITCFNSNDGQIVLTPLGGNPGYTFQWTPNVSNTETASGLSAGVYDILVTDNSGCSSNFTFNVTQPAPIGLSATSTDAICFGESTGSVASTTLGGVSPFSFNLIIGGSSIDNNSTGQFINVAAGTYEVVVVDANSCLDTVIVLVGESPSLLNAISASDVSCNGLADGQIAITTSGGTSPYTFSLSNNASNNTGNFSALAPNEYIVTVSDANNCSVVDTVEIGEPDVFTVEFAPDSISINLGESVILEPLTNQSGNFIYNWRPSSQLSCDNCQNPEFSGFNTIPYTLTVVNDFGCSASASILVNVDVNHNVFAPNIFTPNGDGENDTWQIYGNIAGIKTFRVLVFDRWGEKLFESEDKNFKWNGIFKDEQLMIGVYVYHVKFGFMDGFVGQKKGSVTIAR